MVSNILSYVEGNKKYIKPYINMYKLKKKISAKSKLQNNQIKELSDGLIFSL